MKAQIRHVTGPDGTLYDAVAYWCPAPKPPGVHASPTCGLHMLPIGGATNRPNWTLHELDPLHLEPSVLTRANYESGDFVCHSFVRNGRVEFLGDCTHELAGQTVDLPDLPDWFTNQTFAVDP